ncbi:magnesium-protoporphyrin IX monomethyl ester anaerobic oxidative cyclase [Neisseria sp. Ec49-e6-T10]|uniref:magnesium-protoporphyrin IX monomethyl ester anaerobic oxidative cyclase n=1 Tax=Neisseria sp. Ec49-e6-T10 TaxID=3140744 RepID=UPI003EB8DF8B
MNDDSNMIKKRILLINVPHPAIGSRIPKDHLPPFGLLCIGGPLLDQGHEVKLLDADRLNMPLHQIVSEALAYHPDIIMFGHSGSSSAHPVILEISQKIKQAQSDIPIVYGGVHPSYFWQEILTQNTCIDFIVRGEGEKTIPLLVNAINKFNLLKTINGIAYRDHRGQVIATEEATMIQRLDDYRIGWELIDFNHYHYWGGQKAVVIQFSRGCPHLCSYCGQREFWSRWRHRDPLLFAKEIAQLHREHGVQVFNFADENFSTSKRVWKLFLEALIEEKVNVRLVASMRSADIVRDADILHLYKKAGFERFLLGLEHTDDVTLKRIKKGSTTKEDQLAIRLLRKHHILSLATWVAGFEEESDKDMWRALKQLLNYDPDQIQLLYVTPHRWTSFGEEASHRKIVQPNLKRWDYKHQILHTPYLKPWRLFLWMKCIEIIMQSRPKALGRLLFYPDHNIRQAMRWYYQVGKKVWLYEVIQFLFYDRRCKPEITLGAYWGKHKIAKGNILKKPMIKLEYKGN